MSNTWQHYAIVLDLSQRYDFNKYALENKITNAYICLAWYDGEKSTDAIKYHVGTTSTELISFIKLAFNPLALYKI
jgi:hypothetical protein